MRHIRFVGNVNNARLSDYFVCRTHSILPRSLVGALFSALAFGLFCANTGARAGGQSDIAGTENPGMKQSDPILNVSSDVMQRDSKAESAIMESMHRLHVAFDDQNIEAISQYIADDDFLFVYELDPEGKPIKLNSKAELIGWLDNIFNGFRQQNASTQARNPVMTARATSTFGMVTEECQLKVVMPDGTIQLEALRATAVARKGADGWKFTHWHMSPSAPITRIDRNGTPIASREQNGDTKQ